MQSAWMDSKYRVVTLNVLHNMCEDVSGTCHRFKIVSESANRIGIAYSNPNEYGIESPMTAYFPCYAQGRMGKIVVLDLVRLTGDNWDGEGWQAFTPLLEQASRNPNT